MWKSNISDLGGLAQLARALAWHARGQRFESVILHQGHTLFIYTVVVTKIFDILYKQNCS